MILGEDRIRIDGMWGERKMNDREDALFWVYAERDRRRDENVGILIRQLKEDGISYRVRAAEALGICGGDEVVAHLIRAAEDDPETDVRFMAIRSLGKRRDPLAIVPLTGMLTAGNKWIRMEAVKALGAIGDPSAARPVGRLCRDPADPVRKAVAEALGEMASEACRSALEVLIDDADPVVRTAAWKSLSRCGTGDTLFE